jgi:GT2 family glycosyltransferase
MVQLMDRIGTIVVPVLNRYDLLLRMLESIDHPVRRVIVVDNGGSWTTWFRSQWIDEVLVWRMPSNLGVGPSWNIGMKATPFEDGWLLVNSDAWFAPGTLAELAVNFAPDRIVRTAEDWACVWVGAGIVDTVGLFSECFVPAYFEDNDYEWRCNEHGFTVEKIGHVRHDSSSTIMSDERLMAENNRSFAANNQMFLDRHRHGRTEPGDWSLRRRRELGWDRPN